MSEEKELQGTTCSNCLKELVELLKPINELAKYQIQNINNDIRRQEIIDEYLKLQQENNDNNTEES